MSDEGDRPAERTITLDQFTTFLKRTRRNTSCPACPHDGQWKFYIEASHKDPYDSHMLEFMHHAVTPDNKTSEQVASYVMECPQCGYRLFTGSERVHEIIYGDNIDG